MIDPLLEPFRIKMVERIRMTSQAERERILAAADLNLFRVAADDVFIDLLTDSGTNAMSAEQWSRMLLGDESYAGARSFGPFRDAVRDILGFPYVLPTHQGRGAESVLFGAAVRPGQVVPSNCHFDTTQANLLAVGARPVDLVGSIAWDPDDPSPFKGNMDLGRLADLIEATGPENIPLGLLTVTNNSAAGQPVSLANIRGVAEIYHRYGIPFFIDAARFAENAWFIREHEPGCGELSIKQIAAEMFAPADGCLMSAKKDAITNIGGFVAMRDPALFQRVSQQLVLHEGFPTYGGLAGRDLEAIAQGLYEGIDEDYLRYRAAQARHLGEQLMAQGVPIYQPAGAHAVYVNAGRLLPHIPPGQFPGVAFAAALYLEGGVRAVEIGSLMFERSDPVTGEQVAPPLELVRLAIPRRVYTRSHLDYVAEAAGRVAARANSIRGLCIVEAPALLRHFTARLAWI